MVLKNYHISVTKYWQQPSLNETFPKNMTFYGNSKQITVECIFLLQTYAECTISIIFSVTLSIMVFLFYVHTY